jgi:hypothetical protein
LVLHGYLGRFAGGIRWIISIVVAAVLVMIAASVTGSRGGTT